MLALVLFACADAPTSPDALDWDRFSVDVVDGYGEADIPAGAVWTAECCAEDGACLSVDKWGRRDEITHIACPTGSGWVDVVWVLPE